MTTYSIPGDLEIIGKPLWDKTTVKDVLRDLRAIESGMARDLEEFPGHPQAHLIAAVRGKARAARRRLEADEGALQAAITDVQHLEKNINEIRLRAGEPDRQFGEEWRTKGRPPGDLSRAIDAALEELDTAGAKAKPRMIFNHICKHGPGVLDPVHHDSLTKRQAEPADINLADGTNITWLLFQKRISGRRRSRKQN